MTDDDMVEDLNCKKFCGPYKVSCKPLVFGGGNRVTRGVIVHEYESCCFFFKCQRQDLARINGTSGECSQEYILIKNQLILFSAYVSVLLPLNIFSNLFTDKTQNKRIRLRGSRRILLFNFLSLNYLRIVTNSPYSVVMLLKTHE